MPKHFIDTNVLVYSIDEDSPEKRAKAIELIQTLGESGEGVISTQVLQEFFTAATRKIGVDPRDAKQLVRDFQVFDVISINPEMIERAIDCSILNLISFWDSLIIRAAAESGCDNLFSEDLQDGQVIDGVMVRNPFR
jgi:predicted nucleic acid-binding protein